MNSFSLTILPVRMTMCVDAFCCCWLGKFSECNGHNRSALHAFGIQLTLFLLVKVGSRQAPFLIGKCAKLVRLNVLRKSVLNLLKSPFNQLRSGRNERSACKSAVGETRVHSIRQ